MCRVAAGGSDDGTVLVGAFNLLLRLDELFARDAQPHDQRAGDQHRGVDAEADPDGQGHGEVVQGFAAAQAVVALPQIAG